MAGRRNRPWYKRYPSDFLAGTRGMRPLLHKTYSRLIDGTYEYGGPLPNDPHRLAHLLELRVRDVPRLIGELAAMGKITVENGLVHNGRADQEMEAQKAHWKPSESPVEPQLGLSGGYVRAKMRSYSPEKPNENYARASDPPRDHAHPRTEAEVDRKGSAPHRAESPFSGTNAAALPPREGRSVAAPVGAAALPPSPAPDDGASRAGDDQSRPGDAVSRHEPVIERSIPQERWNELRQSLGAPGSKFDPSKPVKEPDHAEPDDRADAAGDRDGEGELPIPAGAVDDDASPDPVAEDAAGAGRGEAGPEAGERETTATDESPLIRALRSRRKS